MTKSTSYLVEQAGQIGVGPELKQTLLSFDLDGETDLAETSNHLSETVKTHDAARQTVSTSGPVKSKKVKAVYTQIKDASSKVNPPGDDDFNNKQLTLFQNFLCNNKHERDLLSNTVELWDSIPRFSVTRRQQNAMRDEKTGSLPIHTINFNYMGAAFRAEIRPAKVTEIAEDGSTRTVEYYPSNREELIEDALRKIASRQSYGFFQQLPNEASGVAFSMYELRGELAEQNHTMSFQEIVQSLDILHFSSISVFKENDGKAGRISAAYLPELAAVSSKQIKDDPSSKWVVHFHPFITQGIMTLTYRQFNYKLMMSLSTQLSRWLHKYLCMKFTQAGLGIPPFEIHYKTIQRDSGLLKAKHQPTTYADTAKAFDELKEKGILASWKCNKTIGPRGKVLGIVYLLTPSSEFIKEAKAANKRQADLATAALCKTLPHASNLTSKNR
jgi:hypothetical protein